MQTTLTSLVVAGRQAYVSHAGDSRAYLLRQQRLVQLTSDHSEAAELLRLRLITSEQARSHPRRSVLTRTLGSNLLMRPDFSRHPLQEDDRLLLCTDGLWGEVEPEALAEYGSLDPEAACRRLIDLACEHGGGDNVSVQVIRVVELDDAPSAPTGRIGRLLAGLRGG
jgi:protein phosphatase